MLPPRYPAGNGHLGLPQRRRPFQAHAGAVDRRKAARL